MKNSLFLLRESIIKNIQINLLVGEGEQTTDLKQASFIQIGDAKFPKHTLTPYKDQSGESFTLDALYFAYIKKQSPHSEYFQECQKYNIKAVSFVMKKDLFEYLEGKKDTSPNLDQSLFTEDVEVETEKAHKKQKIEDTSIRQILGNERTLIDRSSILSCASQKVFYYVHWKNFDNERRIALELIGKKKDVSQQSKMNLEESQKNTENSKNPIIIVPASLTSLISLYNAKSFLEKGVFKTTEESKNLGGEKRSPIQFEKTLKNGKTIKFLIYDNADRLKAGDWARVVAVFASGQKWQFKSWKWTEPVEIFSKVKGFYLKYSDSSVDPLIKQWNVTILEINRNKRHFDMQCIHQFWGILEQWMISKFPSFVQ